jgi:hypothetical protein
MTERRRTYFGFQLETEVEAIEGEIPPELQDAACNTLAHALWQGETTHPDQNRLRRTLAELDELWRRSGGTLQELSPESLRASIRRQLDEVRSWDDFMRTRIALEPAELIDDGTRARLDALPGRIHLKGDAVPLDYEVQNGEGVARVRLRQGQAKRLRADELPPLDRPLRFAVQRGHHQPLTADTIPALQALLRRSGNKDVDQEDERPARRGGGPPNHRRGPRTNRRGKRNRPPR